MPKITALTAYEILDSRGEPTIQAIVTAGNVTGEAKVATGVSVGSHEALEVRDKDNRYGGKGVLRAVANIKGEIQAALIGRDTANQNKVDHTLIELDGTVNKSRLGANALLAVSLAVARTEAISQGLPLYLYLQQLFPKREFSLPVPHINLINEGRTATSKLSIQEYHVLPIGSPRFSEAIRMGVEIYAALKDILAKAGFATTTGNQAGFSPQLESSETVFTLLVRAIEVAGYVPGVDAFLGIDVAASEFYDPEKNEYKLDGMPISAQDLFHTYISWKDRYPIISIEDPFAQDAWDNWKNFLSNQGKYLQVVGDDLYAANSERIRQGIVQGATNAVLIKPNQVGTLTETLKAILLAQEAQQKVIISHRSGETEDTFIADLAVAVGAGQIKAGAPARSDRTAKYNRLLQIEGETQAKLAHDLQSFLEHRH